MLTIPIPMMVALILGFLAIRQILTDGRARLFLMLLLVCALQSLVVSLVQHYGLDWLAPIQPITASFIPVIAWLTFLTAALRPLDKRRDLLHAQVPLFTGFCAVFTPATLDAALIVLFVGYGATILFRLRQVKDVPLARLESGALPIRIWTTIGCLFIVSALSDLLIFAVILSGHIEWRPYIISIFSSVSLLGIGLLSLSDDAADQEDDPTPTPQIDIKVDADFRDALMERLNRLMREEQLFLDTELTLARLARRLHTPIKQLSEVINEATGENVSRYVNGFRIEAACQSLKRGDTVTEAMLSSGFNTKSNFNREFKRVTGSSPSAYATSSESKA